MVRKYAKMSIMAIQNDSKLNRLQHDLPEGLVVDASWLEDRGYSRALRTQYVSRNWLQRLAHGVYQRPTAPLPSNTTPDLPLRWQNVVVSLQTILERSLVVGGRTALELQGFAHYLGRDFREVHLYENGPHPTWVDKLHTDTKFVFHNANKLFKHPLPNRLEWKEESRPMPDDLVQQPWGQWDWPLTLSTPERAVLELLDEVPQRETFHQANMLIQGLRNLSPKRLQRLLLDCRSVKVKRLFLWFAERHNHAWLKHLHRAEIDLGNGKRMLVRGGKLDPKFEITVPENLDADS
jgi:hypothetical protein